MDKYYIIGFTITFFVIGFCVAIVGLVQWIIRKKKGDRRYYEDDD